MSRTVARPVLGRGWGRCTTILSLPIRRPIRDPERLMISTPKARSMASRSRHRMSDGVGVAKARSSTLRCSVLTVQGIQELVLIQVPLEHHLNTRRYEKAVRLPTERDEPRARPVSGRPPEDTSLERDPDDPGSVFVNPVAVARDGAILAGVQV